MQVSTIQEERHVARQKYAEYLKAVKSRHTQEYVALKNAYRELSKGRQVIDLIDVMKTAGTDQLHRPRLAIVRADANVCWYRRRRENYRSYNEKAIFSMSSNFSCPPKNQSVALPRDTFEKYPNSMLRAVVPSIPPSLMPDGTLDKYHILWEAEWESVPVDPMLLKHLGKNLYVVLATWDLTPLEQAVLRDR